MSSASSQPTWVWVVLGIHVPMVISMNSSRPWNEVCSPWVAEVVGIHSLMVSSMNSSTSWNAVCVMSASTQILVWGAPEVVEAAEIHNPIALLMNWSMPWNEGSAPLASKLKLVSGVLRVEEEGSSGQLSLRHWNEVSPLAAKSALALEMLVVVVEVAGNG